MVISIRVLPSTSEKRTVTRKSGRPIVVAAMVVDEFGVRLDLVIQRLVGVVDAVRTVHGVGPMPARPEIFGVRRESEAPRSPPMGDLFRIGPGVPHRFHRRVVHAADPDLVRLRFCDHGAFLWPALFAVTVFK